MYKKRTGDGLESLPKRVRHHDISWTSGYAPYILRGGATVPGLIAGNGISQNGQTTSSNIVTNTPSSSTQMNGGVGNTQPVHQASNANPTQTVSYTARDSVGDVFNTTPLIPSAAKDIVLKRKLRHAQPTGLRNSNNLCYRNAALTAFLSSEIVLSYLQYWRDSNVIAHIWPLPHESIIGALHHIAPMLFFPQNLTQTANQNATQLLQSVDTVVRDRFWNQFCWPQDANGTCTDPVPENSWRCYSGSQTEDSQEDAFLFLGWMISEIRAHFPAPIQQRPALASGDMFDWLFVSRHARRIVCDGCKYPVRRRAGVTQEPFLSLVVPSPKESPGGKQLSDLIVDALESKQAYSMKCPRCKKDSQCTDEIRLQHAPALLMILLGRANGKRAGKDARWKNFTAVQIPDELDMSRHLNAHEFGTGSKITYALSSVVSHHGMKFKLNDTSNKRPPKHSDFYGHYISYVRGLRSGQWFEMDDDNVTAVSKSRFDDTNVGGMDNAKFRQRFTPHMLFYERKFAEEDIQPGRAPMNANEGGSKDERPSQWTGTPRAATPAAPAAKVPVATPVAVPVAAPVAVPVSTHAIVNQINTDGSNARKLRSHNQMKPNQSAPTNTLQSTVPRPIIGVLPSKKDCKKWVKGSDEDKDHSPAVVLVTVTIAGVEIKLDPCIISQFDHNKLRDVKIEAKLRTPTCKAKKLVQDGTEHKSYAEIDLIEAQEATRERNGIGKKSKGRSKNWTRTRRNSEIDLTAEDIKKIGEPKKQVRRASA